MSVLASHAYTEYLLMRREVARCSGPGKEDFYRALADVGTATDCVTLVLSMPQLLLCRPWKYIYVDLVVSLPIMVLHRVHLTRRQKLAVGSFTSLSISMIIIAIIRTAKLKNPQGKTHDGPLQAFLTYIEACILAVSTTTFRSIFNHSQSQAQPDKARRRWTPGALTRRRSRRTESEEQLHNVNVTAPEDALPGLRTYVTADTGHKRCDLARKESVLRTREVVVEVTYEKDLEKGDWGRLGSPSWMDEKWRVSESSEPGN